MSASPPVEVLHADGELAPPDSWFPNASPDSLPDDPFFVVAIAGPQASGKSTLVNAIFSTTFPVADGLTVGVATTPGILAQRITPSSTIPHDTLVFDVEGADARSRGRDAKLFAAQSASFVAALADVVIINIWFHDACRYDSAAYALIRSVLNTSAQAVVDGASLKSALVVVVRDFDDDSDEGSLALESLVAQDVEDIWADVTLERGMPVGDGATALSEVIDLNLLTLPHFRHQEKIFNEQVSLLRERLYGQITRSEHSKLVPANGLSTYAQTLWESVAANAIPEHTGDEFYAGEDFAIVAGFRCDEAFSDKLAEASGDIADLLDKVENGERLDHLGQKCDRIVDGALQQYDVMTTEYVEEGVYERKRKELEVILDTALNTVYMKNVSIVSRESLATFKSQIAEEMPADYAIYSVQSKFVKQAKEGIRQGSAWTFEAERVDLENMMKEMAAQQRKLMDTQVTASQQQSKAIQILRMQHAQMQAVQQQAMGGAVGQWNVGAAYRPPDSNVNLSLAYQQGRTNLQVSMVPDESSSLLGPTGFTAGVGPGNLGMSFNVNF